jgi:ubiquinone/menaquinone biosynthesis C-methylase UbiE
LTDDQSNAPQFDQYAENYEQVVNQSLAFLHVKQDYFTRVKAAYLLDLLGQHFGDTSRLDLLDVGCGIGNIHPLVLDRLGAIAGVDVSAKCLAAAAQRNPRVDYRHYDGARLPFDGARFDAVTTICVMHHVPPAAWPAFVTELRRVLKPGGLAVVFEHNPRNPLTSRVVAQSALDEDAVLLRLDQMRQLLDGAGFKGVSSRSILSVPTFGKLTRAIDLMLGRLGLGAQYFVQGTV